MVEPVLLADPYQYDLRSWMLASDVVTDHIFHHPRAHSCAPISSINLPLGSHIEIPVDDRANPLSVGRNSVTQIATKPSILT